MNETEPKYIIQLKDIILNLDRKLDSGLKVVGQDIKEIKGDITKMKGDITGIKGEITGMKGDIMKIKEDIIDMKDDINRTAITTNENVNNINWIRENMVTKEDIADMVTIYDISDMATKSDLKPILNLIGSYEVRAKNTEDIVLHDHKPRIVNLEKEVFV